MWVVYGRYIIQAWSAAGQPRRFVPCLIGFIGRLRFIGRLALERTNMNARQDSIGGAGGTVVTARRAVSAAARLRDAYSTRIRRNRKGRRPSRGHASGGRSS